MTKKGAVKWFSYEKGYGFIASEGVDYYFNVKGISGVELPGSGDQVVFDVTTGSKGLAATRVIILSKQAAAPKAGQVPCPHCKNNVYPRLVTDHGSAAHSLCPICGKIIKDFGSVKRGVIGTLLITLLGLG
ncbi:cold-shock protein [Cellvibrio sp. QJXJ]|uniref:cold-shock protein n=1 Tax=Cellvibrio sp. QJXJ TaxID=2964606 RepID=UPI0021C4C434|nr:cold shock domain-containing protein [Cellvibrio sp. QJXJ]UUA74278.1 cold shock domain-containing protein [Cellvibrio sp. QJXJ]